MRREIHVNIEELSLPETVSGHMARQELREAIARDVEARMANPSLERAESATLAGRIGKAVYESLRKDKSA
jgi:hypothetical protein